MFKNIWLMIVEQVRNDLEFTDDFYNPWMGFYWGTQEAWFSNENAPWRASYIAKELMNQDIPF